MPDLRFWADFFVKKGFAQQSSSLLREKQDFPVKVQF